MSSLKYDYYIVYNYVKENENGCGSMIIDSDSELTAGFINHIQESIKKDNELNELLIMNIVKLEKEVGIKYAH